MAARYGQQKDPRLGGEVRLRVSPKPWRNKQDQVRRLCKQMEVQLVRVAHHRYQGKEQLLLLTDQMVAHCVPQRDESLLVVRLDDTPPAEIMRKFSSYMSEADVTIEWD